LPPRPRSGSKGSNVRWAADQRVACVFGCTSCSAVNRPYVCLHSTSWACSGMIAPNRKVVAHRAMHKPSFKLLRAEACRSDGVGRPAGRKTSLGTWAPLSESKMGALAGQIESSRLDGAHCRAPTPSVLTAYGFSATDIALPVALLAASSAVALPRLLPASF